MELDFAAQPVRYFVAVAEEGQISRAAERLDALGPEQLSDAISQLEEEIGLELIAHHAGGVTLTPVGEVFLAKARRAIAAYDEAVMTGQRLGRIVRRQLQIGFVGPPPPVLVPGLLDAFLEAQAGAELMFSDLQFPRRSTASWLGPVDVALCFSPTTHRDVREQPIRDDSRVVVAPRGHRLSARQELTVAEVIDELFVGFDPAIECGWAGMLTLDDHRRAAPARVTDERAGNALEMLTTVASQQAIVVLAASHGEIIRGALPNLAVIPLRDAEPTTLTLVWRADVQHPLVDALADVAKNRG